MREYLVREMESAPPLKIGDADELDKEPGELALDGKKFVSSEFPMDCPLHDSLLRVHYKGMILNEEKMVFYDTKVENNGQPLEFSSGDGLVSSLLVRSHMPSALVPRLPSFCKDLFGILSSLMAGKLWKMGTC